MMEYLQNFISWLPLIAVYYAFLIPGKFYKAHKNFKADSNVSIKLPPELKKVLSPEEKQKQVTESLNRYLVNFSKAIE